MEVFTSINKYFHTTFCAKNTHVQNPIVRAWPLLRLAHMVQYFVQFFFQCLNCIVSILKLMNVLLHSLVQSLSTSQIVHSTIPGVDTQVKNIMYKKSCNMCPGLFVLYM